MQKLHIFVEFDLAIALNRVLYLESVARFEQYRRVIDKLAIQHRIDAHYVFVDLRLDLVRDVVIDGVSHVLGQYVLEALLIEGVIVEDLDQDIQETLILVRIEAYLEDFIGGAPVRRAPLVGL